MPGVQGVIGLPGQPGFTGQPGWSYHLCHDRVLCVCVM